MNWFKQLFTRRRRYDELSESIREHLDEKIADLMDRGMTLEEAERPASPAPGYGPETTMNLAGMAGRLWRDIQSLTAAAA